MRLMLSPKENIESLVFDAIAAKEADDCNEGNFRLAGSDETSYVTSKSSPLSFSPLRKAHLFLYC